MSEQILNIARLALNLPENWNNEAWNVVAERYGLVEASRTEDTEEYDWSGQPVLVYTSPKGVEVIQFPIHESWAGDEWDGNFDPFYAELLEHFQRTVALCASVLGPPQFLGNPRTPDFPGYLLSVPNYQAAVWELPEGILVVRADDSQGDSGPWIVSIDLEPYDE